MKKFFLFLFLSLSCLYAKTGFTTNNQKISINGKDVGFITMLTPIEIINDKNEALVTGYMKETYQEKIVKSPILNEEYVSFVLDGDKVSFDGETNPYVKILDKTEDEYGEIWLKCELKFNVDQNNTTKDPTMLYNQAKNLYEQTCSACHTLHEPTEYTVNQWPFQVDSMISSGFVGLDEMEKNSVIKYLQHNAKDSNSSDF